MEEKNTYRGIYFFNDIADLDIIKQQASNRQFLAIIMHKSGILQFRIEDRQYTLSHNDILFCTPMILSDDYTLSSDFKARGLLLDVAEYKEVFHDMFLHEEDWWKRTLYIHNHPVMHITSEAIELGYHIEAIVSHIRLYMDSKYSPKMLQSLLQIFVCMLMAHIDEQMKQEKEEGIMPEICTQEKLGRSKLIFKDFLVLLNEKRPRSRFCSWYAEQLCITEKHLSSICKRVSGKTATQWINEMVTEDIRHLLLHSELSIKEIAMQLEFPNLSFFGKYTKQHLGYSPKQIREQAKA